MKFKYELGPQAVIPTINAYPGMDAGVLDSVAEKANAIIIVVFANGGSPQILNPSIKKITENGVPIFLVSDNAGAEHGITRVFDQTQIESAKAGAIFIEKANINNLSEISKFIQQEFAQGKSGSELGESVREHFSYKEGEQKPVMEWEDPATMKNKDKSVFDKE